LGPEAASPRWKAGGGMYTPGAKIYWKGTFPVCAVSLNVL